MIPFIQIKGPKVSSAPAAAGAGSDKGAEGHPPCVKLLSETFRPLFQTKEIIGAFLI